MSLPLLGEENFADFDQSPAAEHTCSSTPVLFQPSREKNPSLLSSAIRKIIKGPCPHCHKRKSLCHLLLLQNQKKKPEPEKKERKNKMTCSTQHRGNHRF